MLDLKFKLHSDLNGPPAACFMASLLICIIELFSTILKILRKLCELNRFTKSVCHIYAENKESAARLFIKCAGANILLPAGGSRQGKIHHSQATLMKQVIS